MGKILLGNLNISKILSGNNEVKKVYLGANKIYEKSNGITDLTGYTWVANNSVDTSNEGTYNINFTCNGVSHSALGYGDFGGDEDVAYDNYNVYTTGQWVNETYKTIQITGGTDATNAQLIAWLQANGTLTETPQPTGYSITVQGVTTVTGNSNIATQIIIDGFRCAVTPDGITTNIPHTYTGVTSFNVSPDIYDCAVKFVSGTGTYKKGTAQEQMIYSGQIIEHSSTDILITPTSDLVIELGYLLD